MHTAVVFYHRKDHSAKNAVIHYVFIDLRLGAFGYHVVYNIHLKYEIVNCELQTCVEVLTGLIFEGVTTTRSK